MAAPHLSVRLVLGFGEDLPDSVVSLNEAILGYGPSRHAIEAPPRTGPALINTRLLSLGTGAFLFGLYLLGDLASVVLGPARSDRPRSPRPDHGAGVSRQNTGTCHGGVNRDGC